MQHNDLDRIMNYKKDFNKKIFLNSSFEENI